MVVHPLAKNVQVKAARHILDVDAQLEPAVAHARYFRQCSQLLPQEVDSHHLRSGSFLQEEMPVNNQLQMIYSRLLRIPPGHFWPDSGPATQNLINRIRIRILLALT